MRIVWYSLVGIIILAMIALIIWSQIYFNQNCLQSHQETYTYYTSQCVIYNMKGGCSVYALIPHQGYTPVCDKWRPGK